MEGMQLSESEWLEKIHGLLETTNLTLATIAANLPDIKDPGKNEITVALEKLNQEVTQHEVLDTLSGYFVNQ